MHGRRCSEEVLMETTLYAREFLFVQEPYRSGRLGKLQFLRASHHQDMTGWPSYWDGMPPMYNATHAIGPTLGLAGHQAEYRHRRPRPLLARSQPHGEVQLAQHPTDKRQQVRRHLFPLRNVNRVTSRSGSLVQAAYDVPESFQLAERVDRRAHRQARARRYTRARYRPLAQQEPETGQTRLVLDRAMRGRRLPSEAGNHRASGHALHSARPPVSRCVTKYHLSSLRIIR